MADNNVGKMTDNDIKKALECYRGQKLFAFNGKKPEIYIHDIIDHINRLEAENENLQDAIDERDIEIAQLYKRIDGAYKEFADRLKGMACSYDLPNYHSFDAVEIEVIYDTLKEMVGENNGT